MKFWQQKIRKHEILLTKIWKHEILATKNPET
jgi:hypothetical protein